MVDYQERDEETVVASSGSEYKGVGVSQQQTDTQRKQPAWWVPIAFGAVLAWLLNNFIAIVTFIATGVVRIGSHGPGYFFLVLGVSVLCSAASFILAICLCMYVVLSTVVALYKSLVKVSTPQPPAQASVAVTRLLEPETPSAPLSRTERLREGFTSAGIASLAWLFVPKRFRKCVERQ